MTKVNRSLHTHKILFNIIFYNLLLITYYILFKYYILYYSANTILKLYIHIIHCISLKVTDINEMSINMNIEMSLYEHIQYKLHVFRV